MSFPSSPCIHRRALLSRLSMILSVDCVQLELAALRLFLWFMLDSLKVLRLLSLHWLSFSISNVAPVRFGHSTWFYSWLVSIMRWWLVAPSLHLPSFLLRFAGGFSKHDFAAPPHFHIVDPCNHQLWSHCPFLRSGQLHHFIVAFLTRHLDWGGRLTFAHSFFELIHFVKNLLHQLSVETCFEHGRGPVALYYRPDLLHNSNCPWHSLFCSHDYGGELLTLLLTGIPGNVLWLRLLFFSYEEIP